MTPRQVVFAGATAYGVFSYCMVKYYYDNSSLRRIFVNVDPAYDHKFGHHH